MPRRKKKQCTNPNLSFQSNAPPLLSHPHPPKIYFWHVTAQVKGKFKSFNSHIHRAGWFKGLTTIHETLRLLGNAAGAISILESYPHSPGTMQPLRCDQRWGSWKPGFPFRLSKDSTHQGTTQAKAQEEPPLLALWSQSFAKSTFP